MCYVNAKFHISSLLSEIEWILGNSNCNLSSHFRAIAQIWLALSLGRNKCYQSNLVTPYDTCALQHDTSSNENIMNLSGVDCDTA